MNTTSKLIVIAVIRVLILPGLPNLQSEETEEEPEYYEVTRYNMRGFTYDKEITKVWRAEEIQQAFEGIDSSLADDKIERKREVLVAYNLLPDDTTSTDKQVKMIPRTEHRQDAGDSYMLLFSDVEGTLGPCFINLLHLVIGSPLFFSLAFGIDFEITDYFGTRHFQFDTAVFITAFFTMGTILLIPFFSPSGYIDAIVTIGTIIEL